MLVICLFKLNYTKIKSRRKWITHSNIIIIINYVCYLYSDYFNFTFILVLFIRQKLFVVELFLSSPTIIYSSKCFIPFLNILVLLILFRLL